MSCTVSPMIELVVIQPTPFCNIDCKYCYLPNRANRSVIAPETVANLFTKVFSSGWAAPEMTVIWHAGEPLVMSVEFYRSTFALIEQLRPPHVKLRHSFQTNGMLMTRQWCDLFLAHDVKVGVSIDGPPALHDARRVTRSGAGTFDRTIAGIRLLRAHKVPFHVITVLSRAAMEMAEPLHDFYVAEGIEQVCFNIEESEGSYVSDMLALGDVRERFTTFMARFWQVARERKQIDFIREIEVMIARILRPDSVPVGNVQTTPFAMLNIDHAGNVSTFSPELLGLKNAAYGDFIVGNINRDSLTEMQSNTHLLAMTRDIDAGVAACRKECEYFSVCGGGAPVNKLSENGSFATTQTAFCTLIEMAMTDLILDALERAEQCFEAGQIVLPTKKDQSDTGGRLGVTIGAAGHGTPPPWVTDARSARERPRADRGEAGVSLLINERGAINVSLLWASN